MFPTSPSSLNGLSNGLPNRSIDSITWDEIRSFILFLKKDRGLSLRTVNVHIAQLRNFYRYVLHKDWDYLEVPCLRFDEHLPVVPTRDEVIAIISSIQNPKHRAEIALLYSSGIRVSELCRLHCNDIRMSTKSIYISVSKNRSDRYAILSEKALQHLIAYIRSEYPHAQKTDWLFPGQKAGEHISTQSVYETFRKQLAALGMQDKGYTLHSLRHAFGLHLYDAGVDIMTIKEAMGHKSLSSTAVYLALGIGNGRNVVSPYDFK